MLKINSGYSPESEATILGFGLEEGNLERLKEGKPICITAEEMQVTGASFVIFYAENKDRIEHHLTELLKPLGLPDQDIGVAHMAETFFLTFLSSTNSTFYIVGLDEISYAALRKGQVLTYRARTTDEERESIQSLISWGQDQEALMQKWRAI